MGQRRMFSLKIINSAKFLKLPIDAQNLYFHLGLRADDDGVVEAFSVMRLIGSNEDNLRVLHAKEFVNVLNDDYVTYIVDWKEHNKIRPDRKIDSIYKDLLVQIVPDIKLIEAIERADRKKKNNNGTSHGQSTDNQKSDNGQSTDGLSKGKVREVNIREGNISECNNLSEEKIDSNSLTLLSSFYFANFNMDMPQSFEKTCYKYLEKGMELNVIIQAITKSISKDVPHKFAEKIMDNWEKEGKLTLKDLEKKKENEKEPQRENESSNPFTQYKKEMGWV